MSGCSLAIVEESNTEQVIGELSSLPDRGVAVLGFALLDDSLATLARQTMVRPNKAHFGGLGLLNSAYAKMEALYQFGAIPTDTYSDLNLMRQIRRDFAHKAQAGLTFETPSIANRIDKLKLVGLY